MGRNPSMLPVWIALGVFGFIATLLAVGIGLTRLAGFGHTCPGRNPRVEELRVRSVSDATREFVIEQGRCPSGIDELTSSRYLDRSATRGIYNGRFALTCRTSQEDTVVQVRSAGRDGIFHTADDVVVANVTP